MLEMSILSIFALAAYRFLPSVNKMMGAILALKNLSYLKEEFKEIEDVKIIDFPTVNVLKLKNSISFNKLSYYYPGTNKIILEDFSKIVK